MMRVPVRSRSNTSNGITSGCWRRNPSSCFAIHAAPSGCGSHLLPERFVIVVSRSSRFAESKNSRSVRTHGLLRPFLRRSCGTTESCHDERDLNIRTKKIAAGASGLLIQRLSENWIVVVRSANHRISNAANYGISHIKTLARGANHDFSDSLSDSRPFARFAGEARAK